jgi:drug/metabolite transporter (DMT)-like permease
MASNNVNLVTFISLLALYMFIYFIDELVIFLISVFGMRASRLEEKHGRLLKLISGTMMVFLGGVMVINPKMMNSIKSSILVFMFAFFTASLIYFIHQKILPKYGIIIGTGLKDRKK